MVVLHVCTSVAALVLFVTVRWQRGAGGSYLEADVVMKDGGTVGAMVKGVDSLVGPPTG